MFGGDTSISFGRVGTKALDFLTNKNNENKLNKQQEYASSQIGSMLANGQLRPNAAVGNQASAAAKFD